MNDQVSIAKSGNVLVASKVNEKWVGVYITADEDFHHYKEWTEDEFRELVDGILAM